MNRTQMIETLVGATLGAVMGDPDRAWLREILRKGFQGAHMPVEALERELRLRGLREFDEPDPGEEFDDDEDYEDEDERAVMTASMVALDRLLVDL